MNSNKYLKFWLPIIGLHALHQLEESISLFQWYIDSANRLPKWLLITSLENAKKIILHPEYFILASAAQLLFVSLMAFAFKHKEMATKILLLVYLSVLSFFLIWHIVVSYLAHSYAPIMVTCIGGLYLIPSWVNKILKLR